MPRPVVPILRTPRASSRARSICPCEGRMRTALSASLRLSGVTATPFSAILAISARKAQGSTTTPLPITDILSGRTTPEGKRLSLYSTLPMTSVWPALWPPWKRTTTSARCDSQSTILPLPSSPHWAPTTATFAMLELSPSRTIAGRTGLLLIEGHVGIRGMDGDEDLPPLVKRKICGGGNPAPSWRRVEHRARVGQGRCAPLARWPSAILDGPCARCCGGSQVGTEGWSFLIEQRDILMLRLPLAPARG